MDLTTNTMNKNTNISNIDIYQMNNRKFDDINDADRVYIVGGDFTIDSNKIAQAVKEGLNNLTVKPGKIETIEKNVFIPQVEIKTIEIPVIIKEIEYKEIERPIIVEKIQYREINTNHVATWVKLLIFIQTAIIVFSFLRK